VAGGRRVGSFGHVGERAGYVWSWSRRWQARHFLGRYSRCNCRMSVSQESCQNDLAEHRERTILKPFNELAFLSTALAKLTMPSILSSQIHSPCR
jgi:hypothetical protein